MSDKEKGILEQIEEELKSQKKMKKNAQEDLGVARSNVSFSETQIRDADKAITVLTETIESLKGIL